MTSASFRCGVSSSLVKGCGASRCNGWSVGNAAPTFSDVHTWAPIASASATRCCQASGSRETRPARITGRLAPFSHAAAVAICSAGAAATIAGM